jgi:hypothetical protein
MVVAPDLPFHQTRENRSLGTKNSVNRIGRHSGLGGDPLDARPGVPILAEQAMGRVEDPKAGASGLILTDFRNVTSL